MDDEVVIIEALSRPATVVQASLAQARASGDRAPSRVGANKGKASTDKRKAPVDEGKALTFMANYGLDTSFGETTITLGLRIKAIDQVLQNHRLTEELVKMVMLPMD